MNVAYHCILANLDALQARLLEADMLVRDARHAMVTGKRNLAIGTIVPLERSLPECEALFRTIMMLHRSEPLSGKEVPS